jgi:hypothetical protein
MVEISLTAGPANINVHRYRWSLVNLATDMGGHAWRARLAASSP